MDVGNSQSQSTSADQRSPSRLLLLIENVGTHNLGLVSREARIFIILCCNRLEIPDECIHPQCDLPGRKLVSRPDHRRLPAVPKLAGIRIEVNQAWPPTSVPIPEYGAVVSSVCLFYSTDEFHARSFGGNRCGNDIDLTSASRACRGNTSGGVSLAFLAINCAGRRATVVCWLGLILPATGQDVMIVRGVRWFAPASSLKDAYGGKFKPFSIFATTCVPSILRRPNAGEAWVGSPSLISKC
ncbi:hypothetical protein R3P38DRAFT_3289718 [Favolaschia claudopus]|uniref:Uncharacterized protein n=1 Tax=Favolaschia claudopus TaxID=2862362 RepID=A0AAV9ZUH0_9AGAR